MAEPVEEPCKALQLSHMMNPLTLGGAFSSGFPTLSSGNGDCMWIAGSNCRQSLVWESTNMGSSQWAEAPPTWPSVGMPLHLKQKMGPLTMLWEKLRETHPNQGSSSSVQTS